MEYRIVTAKRTSALVYLVSRYIEQGWEPLGGPYVLQVEGYGQAMIKRIY